MIRFLRRRQPRNRALAVVYWVVITLAVLAGVFVAFYYLDSYLPGDGMF